MPQWIKKETWLWTCLHRFRVEIITRTVNWVPYPLNWSNSVLNFLQILSFKCCSKKKKKKHLSSFYLLWLKWTYFQQQVAWKPMRINVLIKRSIFNSSLAARAQQSISWICQKELFQKDTWDYLYTSTTKHGEVSLSGTFPDSSGSEIIWSKEGKWSA